jgi:hypothetical protein
MATRAWQFAGGRSWPVEAQEAGDELERIRDENGGQLRPEGVVEAARDPGSPLHDCFEWDDTRAGEKFRRIQASALIRSIRVLVVQEDADTGEQVKEPVRYFLNVIPEASDSRAYLPRTVVASTPSLFNQALNDCISYLRAAESRLAELRAMRKELNGIKQIRLRLERQQDARP